MHRWAPALAVAIGIALVAGCGTETAGTARIAATVPQAIFGSVIGTPATESVAAPVPPVPAGTTASVSNSPAGSTSAVPARPTGSAGPTDESVPATAPSTVDGSAAQWLRADGDAWFQTADGKIRCAVGPSQGDGKPSAVCDVAQHSYHLPAAPGANCPNWGNFLVLAPSGAQFICFNDSRFDQAATTLPVNISLHADGFTCSDGPVTVVCQYDSTTQAMTISSAKYVFSSTTSTPVPASPRAPAPPDRAPVPPTQVGQPATVDGHAAPWNSGGGWAEFQSPSGNVSCLVGNLGDDGQVSATCEIRNHTYAAPARPSSCGLDYGDRFIVGASGKATLDCHGDTIADPSYPTLPYGTSITFGSFACTSSHSGMWCGNADTGHYFKIASAAYELG